MTNPGPIHACAIWLDGDRLTVELPSQTPGARPHTVHIPLAKLETSDKWPAAIRGWHVLASILRARAQATPTTSRVGHKAAPVRYDIETMLRQGKPKSKPQAKPQPATLSDLGLD